MGEILLSEIAGPSSPRPLFEAILVWQSQAFPPSAVVDSGADVSFLDQGVVNQMGLDTIPLNAPLDANALNGKLLFPVCEKIVPFILHLSGNQQENISFHMINSPNSPLVLGHPWLKLHNPQIQIKSNVFI